MLDVVLLHSVSPKEKTKRKRKLRWLTVHRIFTKPTTLIHGLLYFRYGASSSQASKENKGEQEKESENGFRRKCQERVSDRIQEKEGRKEAKSKNSNWSSAERGDEACKRTGCEKGTFLNSFLRNSFLVLFVYFYLDGEIKGKFFAQDLSRSGPSHSRLKHSFINCHHYWIAQVTHFETGII